MKTNLSESMLALGTKRSAIRELFEFGKKRKEEIGSENVFDFSLGNPSVPTPHVFTDTLEKLIQNSDPCSLHGYTSAQGDLSVRSEIANYLQKTYLAKVSPDKIYMTCGAAASLTITLHAIHQTNDEIIVPTPYFPEYKVFIEKSGAKIVEVKTKEDSFDLDVTAIEKAITEKTKAIIINSPNNPTGVIFSKESIERLANLLDTKSKEYDHVIYIISDEPYRELVYGEQSVPYIPNFYENTISCYSFSKSLSLPGERIGYIAIPDSALDADKLFFAVCGAGRALGFVCAPSLFQYAIKDNLGLTSDISIYQKNRDILFRSLSSYGYSCIHPDGAFYLFVKAMEHDANAFCEVAKQYNLLLVPSDSFGVPGYVRISYCVDPDMILKSLGSFEKLAKAYGK